MKRFFLFFLLMFIGHLSFAKCGSSGIYLLSKTNTINRNGLMVLEFYGNSRLLVPELNKKYAIYLQSGNFKNVLIPIQIFEGEFGITQVVLKSAAALKPGQQYALHINGIKSDGDKPKIFTGDSYLNIVLTVKDLVDNTTPQLLAPITYKNSTMVEYGCGPAKWVNYTVSAKDESELFVKATVKNKISGKTTEYVLAVENGMIKLGHGMCSGGFHFNDKGSYELKIVLYDQSGNFTQVDTALLFEAPTVSTVIE